MPHRFTHRHGGGHRHVERAQSFSHGNDEPRVGGCVHLLRHARRFAAEQQDVAAPERVREIRAARAFRRGDVLLFGRETSGVPEKVHAAADARLVIPMREGLRSLNVAMAAAMAVGEAMRQVSTSRVIE